MFRCAEEYDNTMVEDLDNDGNLSTCFDVDLTFSAKIDYVRDRIRDKIVATQSRN